jgi:D-lactate dehydrogenase
MKVIFTEVQEWEKEILTKEFPDAVITPDKLDESNAQNYADAEVISCFIYSTFSKEVLAKLPNLKFIATRSTGYDHIDIETCKEKNIKVSNVPEYGSNTVAEHTFALILDLTRKIHQAIQQTRELNFEHADLTGIDLYGKTIGIVGMGKIGQHVARIANGFGMNVIAFNRRQDPELAKVLNFKYVALFELLRDADIITLHLPLTPETHHIINRVNINTLKKGSYVINTARGGLIETEALLIGLEKDILAGVGLDVLEEEKELDEEAVLLHPEIHSQIDYKTLVLDHILINHPHVVITPHNAFNSKEALMRILMTTIDNIKAYSSNQLQNVVDKT